MSGIGNRRTHQVKGFRKGQLEIGAQNLKELSESYPSNPFHVQKYGFVLLFQPRRVDDAIPVFEKATLMTNREAERHIVKGTIGSDMLAGSGSNQKVQFPDCEVGEIAPLGDPRDNAICLFILPKIRILFDI